MNFKNFMLLVMTSTVLTFSSIVVMHDATDGLGAEQAHGHMH